MNLVNCENAMALTNDEFYNATMYFTDEVKVRVENDQKYVNEFLIAESIGHGAYSKVKRVIRQ